MYLIRIKCQKKNSTHACSTVGRINIQDLLWYILCVRSIIHHNLMSKSHSIVSWSTNITSWSYHVVISKITIALRWKWFGWEKKDFSFTCCDRITMFREENHWNVWHNQNTRMYHRIFLNSKYTPLSQMRKLVN